MLRGRGEGPRDPEEVLSTTVQGPGPRPRSCLWSGPPSEKSLARPHSAGSATRRRGQCWEVMMTFLDNNSGHRQCLQELTHLMLSVPLGVVAITTPLYTGHREVMRLAEGYSASKRSGKGFSPRSVNAEPVLWHHGSFFDQQF